MAKEKVASKEVQQPKDKAAAKKALFEAINKEHGKGTVSDFSSWDPGDGVQSISSGSLQLDRALGVGGYPRGRIIEIYGPESSGKTTLTLHAVAECQKLGGLAAFVDAEHALDTSYARNLGVDVDNLTISQPDNGEQALDIVERLVLSGIYDMIVIDSVAALVPKAEIDGEMGDSHVGLQARLMSQATRKLKGLANNANCTLFFINQLRSRIGVMYGSPETTTGGNALKFYASVRLDIRRKDKITIDGKKESEVIGNKTHVKVVKNKVAPPFKEADFNIIFGKGVDRLTELFEYGVHFRVIDKAGAWYSFNGERVGQGIAQSVAGLRDNDKLRAEIEEKVMAVLKATKTVAVAPPPPTPFDPETGEVLEEDDDEE